MRISAWRGKEEGKKEIQKTHPHMLVMSQVFPQKSHTSFRLAVTQKSVVLHLKRCPLLFLRKPDLTDKPQEEGLEEGANSD